MCADNDIGAEGAASLAACLPASSVTSINLYSSCFFLAQDITQCAMEESRDGVCVCDLMHTLVRVVACATCCGDGMCAGNNVGDEGAASLATCLPESSVISMVLEGECFL